MKRTIYALFFTFIAVNLIGQPYPDRHTTNTFDGWISCEKSANPNPARGISNWIMYDLGQGHNLYDITIWNMNHPDYSNDGIKNALIEYSSNGSNWTLADTVTIPLATTSGFYQGFRGPDLGGANARYVLITALDNHGGGCYALSEVRIYTEDQTQDSLDLTLVLCETDGIYQNISSGLTLGGNFSGMGVIDNGDETFDFDAVLAGPGLHEIIYNHAGGMLKDHIQVLPCTDGRCPDCADCVLDDTMSVNMDPIPEDQYRAYGINSAGRVTNSSDVQFTYNESVQLNSGFEVTSPSTFLVEMRHCDVNVLQNPGFEAGTSNWSLSTQSGATANWVLYTADPYEETQSAQINVTNATGTDWHIQFLQGGHSIENGKSYKVSFAARATGATKMGILVQLHSSPWTVYGDQTFDITPYWEVYEMTFTADETVNGNIKVSPLYGEQAGTFYIDKVKFVELD